MGELESYRDKVETISYKYGTFDSGNTSIERDESGFPKQASAQKDNLRIGETVNHPKGTILGFSIDFSYPTDPETGKPLPPKAQTIVDMENEIQGIASEFGIITVKQADDDIRHNEYAGRTITFYTNSDKAVSFDRFVYKVQSQLGPEKSEKEASLSIEKAVKQAAIGENTQDIAYGGNATEVQAPVGKSGGSHRIG